MSQLIALKWPPDAADDQHLSSLPKSDWAWEFLRRNAGYQRAASGSQIEMVKVATVGSAIPVYKLQKPDKDAQEWALCSFRGISCLRKRRSNLLARRSSPLLHAGARAPCAS
jgi:hypothetical protein